MKRLAVLIGAGALLLGGIAAATPAQASVAGPACSGPGCFGKSPSKFVNRDGVACYVDAYLVRDSSTSSGLVIASPDGSTANGAFMMYSPSCNSNWAVLPVVGNDCGGTVQFKVEETDHRVQDMTGDGHFYDDDQGEWYYSWMVDGTGPARVGILCTQSSQHTWAWSHWK